MGLSDGMHWLQLINDDRYPSVYVKCSNEFMIIDVEREESLKEYFSSWNMYHYGIAGPINGDMVNWDGWYLPSEHGHGATEYTVSQDCDVCERSSDVELGLVSKNDEALYMTGNLFGCFWYIRGLHDCDMDWDTYECYYCKCDSDNCDPVTADELTQDERDQYYTGTCATLTKSSTIQVSESHDSCTSNSGTVYKPSLGTDGRNCVCVQPSKAEYFEVNEDKVNVGIEKELEWTENSDTTDNSDSDDDIYYLHQSDFTDGTYRITESGTYIIMEDITFDFNSGVSNEDGAWLPHEDQTDTYPGATGYHDAYFLGFFAGITVETDNVIIDLNGKTLAQSKEFYYQQRWFSHIELANQPFMPAQGPGMFGATVSAASNVEIKNGIFSLTSHHAIHGNRNKNVKIHDIEIKNFETHGIQLNGFESIELYNIQIHSTSDIAYLKGEYGHARMLLPRLKNIYNEDLESNDGHATKIIFGNRGYRNSMSMKDIYEEIEKEIDMAFEYATQGTSYEDDNDVWQQAKENFIYMKDENDDLTNDAVTTNSMGLPYGTAVYGILLSFPGANVFSYGSSHLKSYDAKVSNIEIYGLRHKMHEYIRFHESIPFNVNPFNAVFDVNKALSDLGDIEGSSYEGSIMTDAYIAMNELTDDWDYLGMQNLDDSKIVEWALGQKNSKLSSEEMSIKCNSDVMTHSGKGIIGIRIDGVDNVELSDIEIYNMYDFTKLGSDACGEYSYGHGTGGGHFLQKTPMQTGFSGNMVQGISIVNSNAKLNDINIHDIGSATGLAYGLALWKDNDIELYGNIINSNIRAGFQVDVGTLDYDDRPNNSPEACGLVTYFSYGSMDTNLVFSDGKDISIESQCIVGHASCLNSDSFGASMLGTYQSCQDSEITSKSIPNDYRTELDEILLAIKDTSDDLIDSETRQDSMGIETSQGIFDNEDLSRYNSVHEDDDDQSDIMSMKDWFNIKIKNMQNGKSQTVDFNLPQFSNGVTIVMLLVLASLFAAMLYCIYKSFMSINCDKTKKQSKLFATAHGYGAC